MKKTSLPVDVRRSKTPLLLAPLFLVFTTLFASEKSEIFRVTRNVIERNFNWSGSRNKMSRGRIAVKKQNNFVPGQKIAVGLQIRIFEVYTRRKSKKLLASATRTKLSGFLPKIEQRCIKGLSL